MNRVKKARFEQHEFAMYAADILTSLGRIASDSKMDILAQLIDLARTEAVRGTVRIRKAA